MHWDEDTSEHIYDTSDRRSTGAVVAVIAVIIAALLASLFLINRNSQVKLPHPVDPSTVIVPEELVVVPPAPEAPASSPTN